MTLEIGIDTFGDVTRGLDGEPVTPARTLRDVVEQAVLAERVGLDVVGIGEHHRDDFAVSAPDLVLAAIAGRTERIRLVTAVLVLSSDDPVRVRERFATLHALSNGRAEIGVGRGSFIESFPLFGLPLERYDDLFEEKLELLAALNTGEPVTWSGELRAPLTDQLVHPATEGPIRTWVGVGGTPESAVRAARYGMALMLAIIGGDPVRFRPCVDLYHRARPPTGAGQVPRSSRTRGATWVPSSSTERRTCSCASCPWETLSVNRSRPSAFAERAIFDATVSGEPTNSAPAGPAASSKASRVGSGHPRSAPIRAV